MKSIPARIMFCPHSSQPICFIREPSRDTRLANKHCRIVANFGGPRDALKACPCRPQSLRIYEPRFLESSDSAMDRTIQSLVISNT